MNWQPIETAPKCRMLAVVDGAVRVVAWGKASHVCWHGYCLADQGAEEFDLCYPTHWMPLPAAPKQPEVDPRFKAAHYNEGRDLLPDGVPEVPRG